MPTRFFSILLFLLANIGFAQTPDSTEHPYHYFNNFFSGGLIGAKDQGTTLSFATNHGVRMNRVAIGLGLGYDNYVRWQTVPLSFYISYDLIKEEKNAVFLSMNAGYSKSWPYESQINTDFYEPEIDSDGGAMLNPMVGWRLTGKNFNVYIMMGYKFQRIDYRFAGGYSIWSYPDPRRYSVQEDIQRFQLMLGFGFK